MDNYKDHNFADDLAPKLEAGARANAFLSRIFTIMALGLGITGLTSWLVASKFLTNDANIIWLYNSPMHFVIMLAPFAFILVMNFGLRRLSYVALTAIFIGFSLIMGVSLSWIFVAYEIGTLFQVFLITGATFGAMALIGMTTKIDLTKMGGILIMALIGLIIASLVNTFLFESSLMDYVISWVGVLIFSGLTAYDTQRFLRMGAAVGHGGEMASKLSVMGALSLYLNFINLFLFLLRIMGGRD